MIVGTKKWLKKTRIKNKHTAIEENITSENEKIDSRNKIFNENDFYKKQNN